MPVVTLPRPAIVPPPRRHHGWRGVLSSMLRDDLTKEFSSTRALWWTFSFLIIAAVMLVLYICYQSLQPVPANMVRAVVFPPKEMWEMLAAIFFVLGSAVGVPKFAAFWKSGAFSALLGGIASGLNTPAVVVATPRDVDDGIQPAP